MTTCRNQNFNKRLLYVAVQNANGKKNVFLISFTIKKGIFFQNDDFYPNFKSNIELKKKNKSYSATEVLVYQPLERVTTKAIYTSRSFYVRYIYLNAQGEARFVFRLPKFIAIKKKSL